MPLKYDKKDKTLRRLHFLFNHEDEYIAEPGRPLDFSSQVKSDINEIIRHNKHQKIENWGIRCLEARFKKNYQHDHVAELLNVSRKAIQLQEGMHKETDVDPFYLEAFSLIYQTSPFDLLGIPNPHLSCPFTSFDNKGLKYCNVIINTLYDENSPDKLAFLETIVKIGKLKLSKYKQLKAFFRNTKTFSNEPDTDPLASPAAVNDEWRKIPLPTSADIASFDSDIYNKKHLYWETYLLLEDLHAHNPARLQTLAQFALSDADTAEKLRFIIQELGYPKDPKSLNKYPVDELLPKPPKRKKRAKKKQDSIPKKTEKTESKDTSKKTNNNKDKPKPPQIPIGEVRDVIYYFPRVPMGEEYRGIKTVAHNTAGFTSIYGSVEKLTALLQQLNFEKSNSTPEYKATSVTMPEYRIDLLEKMVSGEEGSASLNDTQVSAISYYAKMVIKKEFSPPKIEKPVAQESASKE